MQMPKLGQFVVFHDQKGQPHDALITAVWSEECVNVLFVSSDERRKDDTGRQIERSASVQHKSVQTVHGFYWRFAEEEPNPYKAPVAV